MKWSTPQTPENLWENGNKNKKKTDVMY